MTRGSFRITPELEKIYDEVLSLQFDHAELLIQDALNRLTEGRTSILIALVALPLAAQEEPQPFARARLKPGPRVTVGQPVTVVVDVLVPNWFTGAPWFPSLDVADAIAVYEDRGTNFTERIAFTLMAVSILRI